MKSQPPDMTGRRFGKWVVLRRHSARGPHGCIWRCRCDCGTVASVLGTPLRQGRSMQCVRCRGAATSKRMSYARWPGLRQSRQQQLWCDFRLRPEDYLEIFCRQSGCCAITGRPLPSLWYNPVDHDHTTGRPVGLIDGLLNRGLGFFGERPEILRRAADYLERVGKQPRTAA